MSRPATAKDNERVKRWCVANRERRREIGRNWARKNYKSNAQKMRDAANLWRKNNLQKAREQGRKRYSKNAESMRQKARVQHQKNRAKNLARGKIYCARTIERRREVRRIIRARDIREKNNAYFATLLRSSLLKTLAGKQRKGAAMELLGCPMDLFRLHLQSNFRDGMAWNNHGSHWHIDHVKPCDSFDLSKPAQQAICFHYSNMQPLLVVENLRKGARV